MTNHTESKLRLFIRQSLRESVITNDMIDEERITNPESKEFVKKRQNFIGSHIYGEKLLPDDPDSMYVTYSYNSSYPAYLWYNDRWFYNTDDFILPDGSVNEFTKQHMEDMKPTLDTMGLAGSQMTSIIHKYMKKHGIKGLRHSEVEPGERN